MSRKKIAQPIFVQLRLDPGIAAQLRQAGEVEGRKLPSEIGHRLKASLAPGFDQAFGAAVGEAAARASRLTGITDQGELLGLMKAALPVMLDTLGATEVKDNQARVLAKAAAKTIAQDLKGRFK